MSDVLTFIPSSLRSSDERVLYYKNISARYTNGGWDRIRRHWEYIKYPDSDSSFSITSAIISIATGAFMGAKLGYKIVEDSDSSWNLVIGTIFGFITGGIGAGYIHGIITERSQSFERWKDFKINETLKEALTFSYSDDRILENFTCPISACMMDVPCRSPSGTVFDYIALSSLTDENNMIADPYRNSSFHLNEIKLDLEMAVVIHKRCKKVIEEDKSNLHNQDLSTSLDSLFLEIETIISERYEKARENIEDRRKHKIVSHEVYKKEIEKFEELFGINDETDLNWDLHWPQILKDRWKYFHPKPNLDTDTSKEKGRE